MTAAPARSRLANKLPTLLQALQMPRGRKYRNAMLEWMRWDGFPHKQRNGWPVEDVRAWIHAHATQIAQYWEGINLASGRVSRGTVALLEKSALQTPRESPETNGKDRPANGDQVTGLLGLADTLRSLAAMLARHYGNRIRILINVATINDWKSGRRLPPGVPQPPIKVNGDIRTRRLLIEEGAMFNGMCKMRPPAQKSERPQESKASGDDKK